MQRRHPVSWISARIDVKAAKTKQILDELVPEIRLLKNPRVDSDVPGNAPPCRGTNVMRSGEERAFASIIRRSSNRRCDTLGRFHDFVLGTRNHGFHKAFHPTGKQDQAICTFAEGEDKTRRCLNCRAFNLISALCHCNQQRTDIPLGLRA